MVRGWEGYGSGCDLPWLLTNFSDLGAGGGEEKGGLVCRLLGGSKHTGEKHFAAIRKMVRAPIFVGIKATTTVGKTMSASSLEKVGARIRLSGACRLRIHPKSRIIGGLKKLRGFVG